MISKDSEQILKRRSAVISSEIEELENKLAPVSEKLALVQGQVNHLTSRIEALKKQRDNIKKDIPKGVGRA